MLPAISNRIKVSPAPDIIDRGYAVGSKSGVHLDERPDSPPAGRNGTFFCRKMWLSEPHFPAKDKKSTMLPQANWASIG
jgi:hypothetical protein